jgi:hypothetical protein
MLIASERRLTRAPLAGKGGVRIDGFGPSLRSFQSAACPAPVRREERRRTDSRLHRPLSEAGPITAPVSHQKRSQRDATSTFEHVKSSGKSTQAIFVPPLITVWLEVRILPGPPGSPRIAEISRRLANSPELAGMSWSRLVSETVATGAGRYFGPLSLARKNTFPGNGDHECPETGLNVMLGCSKSEHLAMRRLFRGRVREADTSYSTGRRSLIARNAHAIVVARAALLTSVSTPPGRGRRCRLSRALNRAENGEAATHFRFSGQWQTSVVKPDVSNQLYNQQLTPD